jgi:hypothetical protein
MSQGALLVALLLVESAQLIWLGMILDALREKRGEE